MHIESLSRLFLIVSSEDLSAIAVQTALECCVTKGDGFFSWRRFWRKE